MTARRRSSACHRAAQLIGLNDIFRGEGNKVEETKLSRSPDWFGGRVFISWSIADAVFLSAVREKNAAPPLIYGFTSVRKK